MAAGVGNKRRRSAGRSYYARLVGLYPEPYKAQYGSQILQTISDMLDGPVSPVRRSLMHVNLAMDLPVNIVKQQLISIGAKMENSHKDAQKNMLVWASILCAVPYLMFIASILGQQLGYIMHYRTYAPYAVTIEGAFTFGALLIAGNSLQKGVYKKLSAAVVAAAALFLLMNVYGLYAYIAG